MAEGAPTYRAEPDVLWCEFEDEAVLLNVRSGQYFSLDPVGAQVWRLLESGQSPGAICAAIVAAYDVDAATCASDVAALLDRLVAEGLAGVA